MIKLFSRKKPDAPLRFSIINADTAPDDLEPQLPIDITLIRSMCGADRSDYWLAKAEKTILWNAQSIQYLIVAGRFVGRPIQRGAGKIALNVAYVIDESLLQDEKLDFQKCAYVAICMAEELTC